MEMEFWLQTYMMKLPGQKHLSDYLGLFLKFGLVSDYRKVPQNELKSRALMSLSEVVVYVRFPRCTLRNQTVFLEQNTTF